MQPYARIVGTGSYLPDNIVTNADLESQVETSDEWIRERTGIRQRHIALPDKPPVIWPSRRPRARSRLLAWPLRRST